MDKHEQAKQELRAFFAAYGDELCKAEGALYGFCLDGVNGRMLSKRSISAYMAIQHTAEVWRGHPESKTLTPAQYERAALAMVDVIAAFES